ncbi:MAG: DUF2508 family protein [Dethiobacter sp.]|jgi:hypothetical protein|nr:DUF2508 family protein [Dethiobacter sp.]
MRVALQKQLVTFWAALLVKLSPAEESMVTKEKDFFELVEEARLEWWAAATHFNHVTDHDLVDYAIYAMEAAERKYTFLLKKADKEGYRLPASIDALRERRVVRANN